MGNVFHLVYFIESFMQQLSYAATAPSMSKLVVWRERRAQVPQRTLAQIAALRFEDVGLSPESYNGKALGEILELLGTITGAAGLSHALRHSVSLVAAA